MGNERVKSFSKGKGYCGNSACKKPEATMKTYKIVNLFFAAKFTHLRKPG